MPLAQATERPTSYSSPAIQARRSRILEETRKVIAEQGIDALSMNDIGKRAGVAKRTLYNAFQTRERMIACAIQDYFDEHMRQMHFASPPATLRYNIERLARTMPRDRTIRNYILAIMAVYFSQDTEGDIWSAIHDMSRQPNLDWLNALHAKRQLQPWIEAERLAGDIVRIEYATISAWAQGHIPDDEALPRLLQAYLTYMAGATKGDARREIEELLHRIGEEGIEKLIPSRKTPAPPISP